MKKGISSKILILITACIAAASVIACVIIMNSGRRGNVAKIVSDGRTVREIDLDAVASEYSFTVEYEGGYNIITVKNGDIRVSDADCPDHICMQTGWLSSSGAPIVCMPHKLVISFEGETDADVVSR